MYDLIKFIKESYEMISGGKTYLVQVHKLCVFPKQLVLSRLLTEWITGELKNDRNKNERIK